MLVVTGGGGFIGGHLSGALLKDGYRVRAVDQKPLGDWWQKHDAAENVVLDLKSLEHCRTAVKGVADFEAELKNVSLDKGALLLVRTPEGSKFVVLKASE